MKPIARRALLRGALAPVAGALALPVLAGALEQTRVYSRPKLRITGLRTAEVRVHGYQVYVRIDTDQGITGQGECSGGSVTLLPVRQHEERIGSMGGWVSPPDQ